MNLIGFLLVLQTLATFYIVLRTKGLQPNEEVSWISLRTLVQAIVALFLSLPLVLLYLRSQAARDAHRGTSEDDQQPPNPEV